MNSPAPEGFYGPRPGDGLFQGDLFLCPASTLVRLPRNAPSAWPLSPAPHPVHDLGHEIVQPAWASPPAFSVVPAVGHAVRWGPVMIVSHECELEKEFNALVRHMTARGTAEADAQAAAGLRPDADRWVLVAPVLTYDEVVRDWPPELRVAQRIDDVRRGLRSGYFPVLQSDDPAIPEGVVALNRVCTVARDLLTEERYLGSLGAESRGVLRYKLARTLAYRDLSVQAELERAVGARITKVLATPVPQRKNEKKQIDLVVHLDNGEVLQMRGAPIRPALDAGPARAGLSSKPFG